MLKRLAGSEFCSDAHRREYKEEYSKLALGRLLQSKPSHAEERTRIKLGTAVSAFIEDPSPARQIAKAAVPVHIIASPATSPALDAEQPLPSKHAATAPGIAAAMRVEKPVPAALHTLAVVVAELDGGLATRTPEPPSCRANISPAALPEGSLIRLDRRMDAADSTMQPRERKLELRHSLRGTKRMDLDMGIAAPHCLEPANDSLDIPRASAIAPPEAQPWMEEACGQFTGSSIVLLDFGRFEFSTTGFEELPQNAINPDSETVAEAPAVESVSYPEPQLNQQRVAVQQVPAGRGKPIQVFGWASFSAGAVQVPQPSGLPLRPVMLLLPATVESTTAPATGAFRAKAGDPAALGRLQPPKSTTLVRDSVEREIAVPGLVSPRAGFSRAVKILVAIAATAVIAIGSFLALSSRSDAGPNLTISTPAASEHASDQWIANFAPEPKQQRKVSVVRSSMGLSDYRMEFEGSIQIKGLGWVYRAQDSNNFYVGKIELEKAGLNPQYVIAHYAVIGGADQARVQTPLQIRVPLGGHYRIRLEAFGSRFNTWINDHKIDEWNDDRLTTGGAGLYGEGVERSTLYGNFRITPLPKKK
jgi:hypothetical protein